MVDAEEKIDLDVVVPGFRKGITKKTLIKSLSEEDWKHIDRMKEAEYRKTKNPHAYALYVRSDQARQNMEQSERNANEAIVSILTISQMMMRNKVDIIAGRTEQKSASGKEYSMEDLAIMNLDLDNKAQRYLSVLRTELARLFTFMGTKGLDREVMLTEDEYNARIEDAISKLSKTGFKLY